MHDEYDEELEHADDDTDADEETVADVFEKMTDKQKMVVYFMVGQALEENNKKSSNDEAKHSDIDEGGNEMKHNVFDQSNVYTGVNTTDPEAIKHGDELRAEASAIFEEASKKGLSLKDTVLAHAGEYGITDIDFLFPDARTMTAEPDFISRNMEWVTTFLNGVKRSPFARIKMIHANITEDAARAKGYTKGNIKTAEVFKLLKRTISPTMIYKKQQLDKQDIIDITSFDVVAYIRREMRVMLNEEIAVACLLGDGRDPVTQADDKIDEDSIIPIYTDADLYTIKVAVPVAENDDENAKAKNLIRSIIKARKDYKGSGNPIFFTTEETLSDLLLVEDGIGRRLYRTKEELVQDLYLINFAPFRD